MANQPSGGGARNGLRRGGRRELGIEPDQALEEGARAVRQPLVISTCKSDRRRDLRDEPDAIGPVELVGGLRPRPPALDHRHRRAILLVGEGERELAVAARDLPLAFDHDLAADRAEQQSGRHRMGGEAEAGVDLPRRSRRACRAARRRRAGNCCRQARANRKRSRPRRRPGPARRRETRAAHIIGATDTGAARGSTDPSGPAGRFALDRRASALSRLRRNAIVASAHPKITNGTATITATQNHSLSNMKILSFAFAGSG